MDKMSIDITGKYTIQDRLDYMIDLVEQDITALALIIPNWRTAFRLNKADLAWAIRESLMLMLEHGARPIQGANDGEFYWTRVTRFGDDPAAIADGLIAEWHAAGVDPKHDGIWMAMPGDVEFRLGEDALP